jgi:hypothetical protein
MYAVQVVQPGRFYDRQHVIHIAIARVSQSILLRDVCGNPIVGVRAGLAGANISLVMNIRGRSVTIAGLPVGSEVFVDLFVPIDAIDDLKSGYNITAYAVLKYFNYALSGGRLDKDIGQRACLVRHTG